jgi:hypothetical protein
MTHPLVYLLAQRPQMLAVHAQAYADLLRLDAGLALQQARKRAVLYITALCMATVATMLTGVAAMLWKTLPAAPMDWPPVMVVTPSVAWILALLLWWAARSVSVTPALTEFKRQISADVALFRELSVP